MSQKNNRLELYTAEKFKKLGFEYARPSKASGACNELGDIYGQDLFIVECKYRNIKSPSINRDWWFKLLKEVPLYSKKLPLLVLENKFKERFAVLDLDDFFRILQRSQEL